MFHQGKELGFSASLKPRLSSYVSAAGVGGTPFTPGASGLHSPPWTRHKANCLAQPLWLVRLTLRNSFPAPARPPARVSTTQAPARPEQPSNAPPQAVPDTPPPRSDPAPCHQCCHHVVWEGPDVTRGGTAQTQKRGRGDSTCCVAAREPDTVVLRPRRSQSPDHVSLS